MYSNRETACSLHSRCGDAIFVVYATQSNWRNDRDLFFSSFLSFLFLHNEKTMITLWAKRKNNKNVCAHKHACSAKRSIYDFVLCIVVVVMIVSRHWCKRQVARFQNEKFNCTFHSNYSHQIHWPLAPQNTLQHRTASISTWNNVTSNKLQKMSTMNEKKARNTPATLQRKHEIVRCCFEIRILKVIEAFAEKTANTTTKAAGKLWLI